MVEMRFVTARACVGVRVCSPWREVPLTQEPAKDQQERDCGGEWAASQQRPPSSVQRMTWERKRPEPPVAGWGAGRSVPKSKCRGPDPTARKD